MKGQFRTRQRACRRPRARLHVATLAVVLGMAPAAALAGEFAVMSYNVRGLPFEAIGEDRTEQIAAIAPLLEDFHTPDAPYVGSSSIVGLQEAFDQDYFNVLTDPQTVSYPYLTDKDMGGPAGIGDGLTLLTDFKIDEFTRVQWEDCFGSMGAAGSDCDTNKGFTYGRVFLEENVVLDVYTLHADAGQDEDSRAARRKNITQLVEAINRLSPEGTPVLVLGDTNSLYTRQGDDNIQDLLAGTGVTDVWVQLRRSNIVPTKDDPIDADCATDPGTANCELVDKIFYRDGFLLVFAPTGYDVLKEMFSDEKGVDLSDHYPVTVSFDYAVVTTTTTTTSSTSTSTSTSTTTTFPDRPCGDPLLLIARLSTTGPDDTGESRSVVAGDALYTLKAAVGSVPCPLCTCDVNNNADVSAVDALITLKAAVGQEVMLNCPPCA